MPVRKITPRTFHSHHIEAISKERYRTGRDSLTTAQVASLLEAFSRPWEKALIHLAIAAGLRRTDLVALKRNDFYPDTGRLTYYEKKKRRTRSITIPSPAAIQDLKMHLNTSRKSEWMFPSPLNGPTFKKSHISDRQAYDLFNEHLDKIGIRRRPFHSLRATCIKLCEKAGWTYEQTAELVGDSVRIIQEHYSTPSDEEMVQIAKSKPIV